MRVIEVNIAGLRFTLRWPSVRHSPSLPTAAPAPNAA